MALKQTSVSPFASCCALCVDEPPASAANLLQSCPTLCDPLDSSPPGFSVHGILQARILEWVAISFSGRSSPPRDRTQVSHIAGRCFTVWATREAIFSLLLTKFAFQVFLPFLLLLSVGEESCVGLWPWIAKYGQLCLSLCNYPMDSSPPGSSVHEISQARRLEWVVISYSRGSSLSRD